MMYNDVYINNITRWLLPTCLVGVFLQVCGGKTSYFRPTIDSIDPCCTRLGDKRDEMSAYEDKTDIIKHL